MIGSEGGFMKNFLKAFFGLVGLAFVITMVYYIYKALKTEPGTEDECDIPEEDEEKGCHKKAAPHSRGYFNLNSIRETEEEEPVSEDEI